MNLNVIPEHQPKPTGNVAAVERSYVVGNSYRDRGGTRAEGDQFLAWVNLKGSGMGNSEGIRSLRYLAGFSELPAYLILVTHEKTSGPRNPWDDIVDYGAGEILYWGDAKAHPTRRHGDFKGNKILEKIYHALLDSETAKIPPILHFSKPRPGVVRFNGLCVLEKLDLSWFDDHGKPVRNFRAHLTILDADRVDLSWLHQRVKCATHEEAAKLGPPVWREYLRGKVKKLNVWKGQIRSVADQLPVAGSLESKVLEQLRSLKPAEFEKVIVAAFSAMTGIVHKVVGTKLTGDGGFDFYGDFVLPRPLAYRISFLGEAKKYSRTTAVGPGEVSRLVARLARGQYGIFVTTSYFTKAAQTEVLSDGYPVRLVPGVDLIGIFRELRLLSGSSLSKPWLETVLSKEVDLL